VLALLVCSHNGCCKARGWASDLSAADCLAALRVLTALPLHWLQLRLLQGKEVLLTGDDGSSSAEELRGALESCSLW